MKMAKLSSVGKLYSRILTCNWSCCWFLCSVIAFLREQNYSSSKKPFLYFGDSIFYWLRLVIFP